VASPLVEDTPQTNFAVTPIGSSQRDVEVMLRMNAESFRLLYPALLYKQLDRVETKVDPLYKEAIGDPVHKAPKSVPVLVIPDPPMKLLKKYGLETEQEAIAIMNCRLNDAAGIYPVTGDLIQYYDKWFEILTVKFEGYANNTQVPLNIILTLKNSNLR
jgi:hypothetical protein